MTEQTTEKTIKIAGVRFRENWKVYDFDATDIEVAVGDRVIVDSERGPGFAQVVRIRRSRENIRVLPPSTPAQPVLEQGLEVEVEEEKPQAGAPPAKNGGGKTLRRILRRATDGDIEKEEKNREREAEAFSMAQDMIAERELPMKLIRVEFSFDASRATFFFFSENRIDFRELVKDLAHRLRSRIEMRQIGVRDVARMIGGFGPCGRELCCSSFLKNFEPVSIRMAKKQEMVLNPAKISGVCGRLLCCLSYEYGMYDEIKKDLADMRETAVKEKKEEEERRVAEERREAEERRAAEEKRRQEERRRQQERPEKQKEGGPKGGGRPEKKKDQQQERRGPPAEQKRARQGQPQSPERQQPQGQKPQEQRPPEQKPPQGQQPPQQEGEKSAKKKRRRFWRRKKKGPQEGGGPQQPQGPAAT